MEPPERRKLKGVEEISSSSESIFLKIKIKREKSLRKMCYVDKFFFNFVILSFCDDR